MVVVVHSSSTYSDTAKIIHHNGSINDSLRKFKMKKNHLK